MKKVLAVFFLLALIAIIAALALPEKEESVDSAAGNEVTAPAVTSAPEVTAKATTAVSNAAVATTAAPATTTATETTVITTSAPVTTTASPTTSKPVTTITTEAKPKQKKVSNEIIYNDNGIIITINSINGLKEINYTIQNNNDFDVKIVSVAAAVNSCMVASEIGFYTVTPSNKVIDSIDISAASYYGISMIEDIDVYFDLEDVNYNAVCAEQCHVDLVDDKSFTYKPEGTLVYSGDNIDMYVNPKGDTLDDIEVIYQNTSDSGFMVGVYETAINGVMLTTGLDCLFGADNIFPDCYFSTGAPEGTIWLWNPQQNEIEEKGLNYPEKISGKVITRNPNSFTGYNASETITVFEK